MTKRTQRFVVLGVTVLVVGLGTGLVASYVGFPNLGIAVGNGPAELAYVPSDSTVVAFADVRDVMDSAVRQKLLKLSPDADSGADSFEAETGINIQTDVDRIVASMSGTPDPSNPASARPLLVARGRFDTARIEAAIRAKGGTVEQYNKQRLITLKDELGLSFVEPDLALVGVPASVRRAIDTKASGKNVTDNAGLMRLVNDFDGGNTWVVAHIEAVTSGNIIPDGNQEAAAAGDLVGGERAHRRWHPRRGSRRSPRRSSRQQPARRRSRVRRAGSHAGGAAGAACRSGQLAGIRRPGHYRIADVYGAAGGDRPPWRDAGAAAGPARSRSRRSRITPTASADPVNEPHLARRRFGQVAWPNSCFSTGRS